MRVTTGWIGGLLAAAMLLGGALPSLAATDEPPYEPQLLRLSEILGALHYLRPLCGAKETSLWRDQMAALIAAEAPSPERKARLVTEFNRGFSGFSAMYRTCTPAAATAIERYMTEGARLTRDLTTRYGVESGQQR